MKKIFVAGFMVLFLFMVIQQPVHADEDKCRQWFNDAVKTSIKSAGLKYSEKLGAFTAAIFQCGENGKKSWCKLKEMAKNKCWKNSYVGAGGAMQFMPTTWSGTSIPSSACIKLASSSRFKDANYMCGPKLSDCVQEAWSEWVKENGFDTQVLPPKDLVLNYYYKKRAERIEKIKKDLAPCFKTNAVGERNWKNGYRTDGDGDGITDITNIYDSLASGAAYLSAILASNNDISSASGEYNGGPNWQNFAESRTYSARVTACYNDFVKNNYFR